MRRQIEAFECAVSVMHFASDPDALWDEFLDPETKRVREYLRKSTRLLQESKRLELERAQLVSLLKEHTAAKHVMTKLLKEARSDHGDEWEWNTKRWRAITRLHFEPWTLEACKQEIRAGLAEMTASWSGSKADIQSTGLSFMGWRDKRRIDPETNALQFNLYKTFRGEDMQHHMDQYWSIYRDVDLYSRIIMGGRGLTTLDVLQDVAENISITRCVEQYPGMLLNAHFLYLLYRVQTPGGYTQCIRSIRSRDLQLAIDGDRDLWTTDFFWLRWEVLGDCKDLHHADYRVTIGGSLAGEDIQYASRWLCEVVVAAVRAELLATGRNLLPST